MELTSLGATRYGGNWSHYRERKALDLAAAQNDLTDAEKRIAEVARKAQAKVERQARRDRAGRKTAAKGDIPRIMPADMKDRSERRAVRMPVSPNAGARWRWTRPPRRREDRDPPAVVGQAAANRAAGKQDRPEDGWRDIGLSAEPTGDRQSVLHYDGARAYRRHRPNGAGKTTLLALITGELKPLAGAVRVMTTFSMLDQQVSLLDPSIPIRDNFRRINPKCR